jgi:integrase
MVTASTTRSVLRCEWTVMEIAGHSALEMTMNVYAHVTLDDKRKALDQHEELFRQDVS